MLCVSDDVFCVSDDVFNDVFNDAPVVTSSFKLSLGQYFLH